MFDKISSGKIYGSTGNTFSAIEIDGDGVVVRNAADELDSSGNLVTAGSEQVLSAHPITGTTINASYIKTGVIDANLMRAGLIQTVPSWNTKWYGAPEDHAAVQMGFTGGSIAATAVSTGTGTVSLTLPGGHGLITGDYVRVSGLYFTTGALLGGVGLNLPTNGPLDYASATVATNTLTYNKSDITSGLTASTSSIVYVGKAHTITTVVRSFDEPENPAELSTVVVTTSAAHGFSVGEYVELVNVAPTIDGVAYITAVDSTTFTFKQRFGADIELDLAESDLELPSLGAPVAIKVLKSYTQNADGSIHITSGTVDSTLIVGEISATEITIGSGENVVRVGNYPDAITPTFQGIWAGSANPSTAEFSANTAGAVTAANLTVTGGSIQIGNFTLNTSGNITDDLIMTQTRIQNDGGVTILDTDSDGEKSLLFGGAALREIQAGVANGSFAEPPPNPYANISGSNKLPYWTFTDVNSSGAITAAIAADATSGSGNALRFTVASGTTAGKSAQISRFVPIPSSRSRSLWEGLEISFAPGYTSTFNAQISAEIDFYANDQITEVIPALDSTPTLAARAGATATITMNGLDHLINIGDTVTVALVSGPTGYAALNGTYVVTAVPSATTFQYTTSTSGTVTSGAATGTVTVSTKISTAFASIFSIYPDNSIQIPDYTLGGARARAATPPANAAYARVVITIGTVAVVLPAVTLAARTLTAATITLGFVHGLAIGDTVTVALTSGPTGYTALNGTWAVTGTPTTTSFTFTTVTSGTITSGAAAGTVTEIASASAATLGINEVRLIRGTQELVINDSIDPNTNSPATMRQYNGSLTIQVGDTTSGGSIPAGINIQPSIAVGSGGTIMLEASEVWVGPEASTDGTITAANVYAETATWSPYLISEAGTSSTLNLRASSGLVTLQDSNVANGTNPRLGFYDKNGTAYSNVKSGAVGVVQILSGNSATTYGQLWAARIYPMNGSTASRYFFDDGTRLASSGGFDANGVVYASGAMVSDAISTTTQTASAAIWVNTSGTTYNLRRNSSSARYKTNIVDADTAVLEASRLVHPRHYESTIEDEAGATRLGFIAEEVHDAGLTHAVGYDAEGRPESLDTTALIAALWKRVEDLEARLAELETGA